MPCTKPITLYRRKEMLPGQRSKFCGLRSSEDVKPMLVPCGQCIHCRLMRSKEWAIRCEHEMRYHETSQFITLTYRDEELVYGMDRPSLYPRHLQLFFKRLRKEYGKVRYFACGEYGSESSRPHYHAIIFGLDFEDKKLYSTENGNNLYHSDNLDRIWSHGHCIVGDATFESAAYVARYVMDKHLGQEKDFYEEHGIEPEFSRMSRRPGIGHQFVVDYAADLYNYDRCVIRNGAVSRPPRFYDRVFAGPEVDIGPITREQARLRELKELRIEKASKNPDNFSLRRMGVKNEVKKAQIKSLTKTGI